MIGLDSLWRNVLFGRSNTATVCPTTGSAIGPPVVTARNDVGVAGAAQSGNLWRCVFRAIEDCLSSPPRRCHETRYATTKAKPRTFGAGTLRRPRALAPKASPSQIELRTGGIRVPVIGRSEGKTHCAGQDRRQVRERLLDAGWSGCLRTTRWYSASLPTARREFAPLRA